MPHFEQKKWRAFIVLKRYSVRKPSPLITFRFSNRTEATMAPFLLQILQSHLLRFSNPLGNFNSSWIEPQWQEEVTIFIESRSRLQLEPLCCLAPSVSCLNWTMCRTCYVMYEPMIRLFIANDLYSCLSKRFNMMWWCPIIKAANNC